MISTTLPRHLVLLICFVLTCFGSTQAHARMLEGTVVAIADGDTLMVRTGDGKLKLRLVYVDAPELGQPYGRSARWALRTLVARKTVKFQTLGRDKYDRLLAHVVRSEDSLDVNYELVARGHAWAYTESELAKRFFEAERKARAEHLGLWRDSHPVRPATWRKNHKSKRVT